MSDHDSAAATTVALLGTGIMGFPMARNLATAGVAVRAWNRDGSKAEPLREYGVEVCADPGSAVAGVGLVVTMVRDADAVAAVIEPVLPSLPDDAVWLQMSTVGIVGERRLRQLAERRGVGYVDAPVLGTKQPAEAGQLIVLAAGPERLRARCAPVFDAVGSKTRWVSDEPGAASALKLVVNSWVLSLNDAVTQALALAEGLGLDPQQFLETIAGTPTDSPYAHVKGKAVLARSFPPAFTVDNAAKDAGLIVEAAESVGLRGELGRAVLADLRRAAELGHGGEDMGAAVYAHLPE